MTAKAERKQAQSGLADWTGLRLTVGRTPWSAADALVGLCGITHQVSEREKSRPGGRLQTRA